MAVSSANQDRAPFGGQLGISIPNCLAYEAGAEALPLWEEISPGLAMKLFGPLAARSPGLRLALALEIERHCSAEEILQGRLIDLVAFVDVDGAQPGSPRLLPETPDKTASDFDKRCARG